MRKPLVAIARRTEPTPAVCELACGHVYTHPLYSGCSSARHYCAQCPEDRGDDEIVAGGITSRSVLVSTRRQEFDIEDNVVRLVRR